MKKVDFNERTLFSTLLSHRWIFLKSKNDKIFCGVMGGLLNE